LNSRYTQEYNNQKTYIEKFTGFGVGLKNYLIDPLLSFFDFAVFLLSTHFSVEIFLKLYNLSKVIIYLNTGNSLLFSLHYLPLLAEYNFLRYVL